MRKPKNEFGLELNLFAAEHGITIHQICNDLGLKYDTVLASTTGRTAGYDVIPAVRKYMAEYPREKAS